MVSDFRSSDDQRLVTGLIWTWDNVSNKPLALEIQYTLKPGESKREGLVALTRIGENIINRRRQERGKM